METKITLEQVEKLRAYANVSYEEAKTALENAEGDILQALVELERQGKVAPPQGGGQYHSAAIEVQNSEHANDKKEESESSKSSRGNGKNKSASGSHMNRFFRWAGEVLHKGNINTFLIERNGERIITLPVNVLVLLILFAFWVVLPLLIVGLFFSYRYSFDGPDLGVNKVNDAMDTVAKAAEEIKKDLQN